MVGCCKCHAQEKPIYYVQFIKHAQSLHCCGKSAKDCVFRAQSNKCSAFTGIFFNFGRPKKKKVVHERQICNQWKINWERKKISLRPYVSKHPHTLSATQGFVRCHHCVKASNKMIVLRCSCATHCHQQAKGLFSK